MEFGLGAYVPFFLPDISGGLGFENHTEARQEAGGGGSAPAGPPRSPAPWMGTEVHRHFTEWTGGLGKFWQVALNLRNNVCQPQAITWE